MQKSKKLQFFHGFLKIVIVSLKVIFFSSSKQMAQVCVLTRNVLIMCEKHVFIIYFGANPTILQILKKVPCFSRIKEAKKEAIFPQFKIFRDVVVYLKYWEKYQNLQICSFLYILWFFGHKKSKSVFFRKHANLWSFLKKENPRKLFFENQ